MLRKHKEILSIQGVETQEEINSIISFICLKLFNNVKFRAGQPIPARAGSGFYFREIPGLGRARVSFSKMSGSRVRERRVNPETLRVGSKNPGFRKFIRNHDMY